MIDTCVGERVVRSMGEGRNGIKKAYLRGNLSQVLSLGFHSPPRAKGSGCLRLTVLAQREETCRDLLLEHASPRGWRAPVGASSDGSS